MTASPDQRVSVFALEDRRHYDNNVMGWNVRWRVGTKRYSRAFPTQLAADGFRSRLLVAVGDGERFSVSTGLPMSWTVTALTVADWAGQWFAAQSPTWAPRSRSNAADTLVKALPLLVADRAPDPTDDIREDIRSWLAGGDMPTWLKRWSLPLAEVTKPVCRAAQAEISVRDDGKAAAPSSINRMRVLMRSLFAAAVEDELIPRQPWPIAGKARAATRVDEAVDIDALPEPDEARAILATVTNHQPSSAGYRVLLSLIYFAGLRPGEALALDAADVRLDADGEWGEITIRKAARGSTKRWTAEEEKEGAPKMGRRRTVPAPPELVALLAEHLNGRRKGLVVATRNGTPVTLSNLDRAMRRVAPAGLVPYDLRHACATLWLRAGVPIGEAAARLGHSPAVLLSTYAGVLSGDTAVANARIDAALRVGVATKQ